MTVEEFMGETQKVPDSRQAWKIKHKMGDIIAIVLMGMLCRCDEMDEIHEWAVQHEKILRGYLELPNGIPSYDTLRRVIGMVESAFYNQLLQKWNEVIATNEGKKLRKVLSIDGKTQCGNKTSEQKPNHIVSAVSEDGVCFGQEVVEEKSNEITAIPALLDKLRIAGQIVTTDAMGTQKEIAKKIVKKKADYVLALKGNHQSLWGDITKYFEDLELLGTCEYWQTTEKARGGIEKREYWQTTDIEWLEPKREWAGLRSIGMTKNTITKNGKTSEEKRYFISSLDGNVKLFARAVRGHWMVEAYHWHLDVTFREDNNQTLDKQESYNLNILRKLALAILRSVDVGKKASLKKKRLLISFDPVKYLDKILNL